MECERAVEYSTGKEFADSLNIPFIETSAKENLNVEEAFALLTAEAFHTISPSQKPPPQNDLKFCIHLLLAVVRIF